MALSDKWREKEMKNTWPFAKIIIANLEKERKMLTKKKYYMYCNLLRTLVGPHTRVWGLSNRDNEREQMLANSLRG